MRKATWLERMIVMAKLPALRKAKEQDMPATLALYRVCAGVGDCTWNELYPGEEEAEEDIKQGH